MHRSFFSFSIIFVFAVCSLFAQRKRNNANEAPKQDTVQSLLEKTSLSGLTFRCVGPALTSGRISDFAVHPENEKIYYVAVSSGGVWKTINAGTTFEPIFDQQGSYSIGVVTMDPNNHNRIWVGTGENNNQRSVAYGDGIYRSDDGGSSWKHMGLKESEHIGSIIVHPENGDIVYVAAIGPLWSAGGDRGVYKTMDGGETWNLILELDEHTGVNEIVMDPRDPDVMYATAFQRRRHVFTYLGGGPGSGIYKTVDGGQNWEKAQKGLPSVDLGRIGLSISPADPEYIYAIVEAAQDKGGLYRSKDRGASWHKRGGYSSSGNYYQEIITDPKDRDKLFAMDTWMQYSVDGGKTFSNVGEDFKHVDNHCIWIDPEDTDHFMAGCDGGIYETWDHAKTWLFRANLPVTQFYKVSVDNAEPFYNIYGGTQDNFSMGGPSRTISDNGIANTDWFVTHGGDGFETQIDPKNPNVIYAQSQYGYLVRYDKATGEELGIKPKERPDEAAYRWNWDAPLEVSNHVDGRLYFCANKVFRSDDRGNSWTVISEDLTRQINRNELKVMGRIWGIDAVAKNGSTSPYGTIVAFSESPLDQNLLVVGTDDGLVQLSRDGGESWSSIVIPGAPDTSYVNEVLTSHHTAGVIYVAFNHHKYGDFKPYVFKSSDYGQTWENISKSLPERGSVYAIEEDHVDPQLLFVGTEFGVHFSNEGGENWKQLKNGLPTIAVRDIAIQERENDLVLGTFGRGFYVLDDYSSLRNLDEATLMAEAALFETRDADLWEWSYPLGLPGKSFQGDNYYLGENLGPEAIITYYLKEDVKSLEDQRRSKEGEIRKENGDVAYPDYDALMSESEEIGPKIHFYIKNEEGDLVRKLSADPSKGVQRISWDLRYASKDPVSLQGPSFYNPFAGRDEGHQVEPGTYQVEMYLSAGDSSTLLAGPQSFEVIPLDHHTLPAGQPASVAAFKKELTKLDAAVSGASRIIRDLETELSHMKVAITRSEIDEFEYLQRVQNIQLEINDLKRELLGDRIASTLDIDLPPSIAGVVGNIMYEAKYSSSDPTQTHRDAFSHVQSRFRTFITSLNEVLKGDILRLRSDLEAAGAPYVPNALPRALTY